MKDFETEEQQIEALKKWWQENGTALIIGLSLGAAVLFGGRYYLDMQSQKSANAGDLYYQVAERINNKNEAAALETTEKLTAEYQSTPYAALASLLMARYVFDQGKADEAVSQLEWVMNNADKAELQNIARLHLARIHLSSKNYEAAMSVLTNQHSPAFEASFEELKGDVYVAQNQLADARLAYDRAIVAMGLNVSGALRLKRQDIGSVELDNSDPVDPSA